jgi:hypothetical protein
MKVTIYKIEVNKLHVPSKRRGHQLLLGEKLDEQVKQYVQSLIERVRGSTSIVVEDHNSNYYSVMTGISF